MIRAWVAVALLAVSWLWGLDYYFPANSLAWSLVVLLGAVLLSGGTDWLPDRRKLWIAMVLLLPAVWFAPWPLRAAPLTIVAGLGVQLLPLPRRWPKAFGQGLVTAGLVMTAQALTLAAYTTQTARSHELPWPLPEMLAGIARLLGADAVADGSAIVLHSIRQVHRLGATWELLVDPATLGFFAGALVVLAVTCCQRLPSGQRWPAWMTAFRALTLIVVAWLPVRAALMMAIYLHRVIAADYALPLHAMNFFLSPWVLGLLLSAPILLAWRFVRTPTGDTAEPAATSLPSPLRGEGSGVRAAAPNATEPRPSSAADSPPWPLAAAALLILLAVALLTAAVQWDPVGQPQAGRVMVVERHSTWEPTDKPYDTNWFGHDSGYNYAAAYAYCGQYFEMSRLVESDKIDDQTLARCDVLVVKIPTARYATEEVDAIVRFVEGGGGLLLVGDHTNYEGSGTYLNDITRRFGFTYRDDLLFGTGKSPYDQLYVPPAVPHPIVQHLPPTDFAVSCSIDPGNSHGRAAVQSTGLWSLPPDYHMDNYHPVPQYHPQMRYGAFVQIWSVRHGQGRVVAFTDSTIFSNFCTFQPGKAELLVGMLDWLNRRAPIDPRPWLLAIGLVPLAAGLGLARREKGDNPSFGEWEKVVGGAHPTKWLILLAAGYCGWAVASMAVAVAGRFAMPVPEVLQPLTRVVIDRTTSQVPLAKGAFNQSQGDGYGLLEEWISRLGCYTVRESGPAAFSGDALVVICPNRSVSDEFREGLAAYVREGGRLLLIDSPENTGSTANSLLEPFGLRTRHHQAWQGKLTMIGDWPGVRVERAREIAGGQTLARLDKMPIAARARYGKGLVMAVGFGSLWNDTNMGQTWMTDPDDALLQRFDILFAVLRAAINDQPLSVPPPRKPVEKAGDDGKEK